MGWCVDVVLLFYRGRKLWCTWMQSIAVVHRLLPTIAVNCRRLPTIAVNCRRLPTITVNCRRLPTITVTCRRLPTITVNCRRLPTTAVRLKRCVSAKDRCRRRDVGGYRWAWWAREGWGGDVVRECRRRERRIQTNTKRTVMSILWCGEVWVNYGAVWVNCDTVKCWSVDILLMCVYINIIHELYCVYWYCVLIYVCVILLLLEILILERNFNLMKKLFISNLRII